ncbi:MAG: OmpH family outer membrane protein [Alphaproteobacteria bacterium]|nr:MAG: OmpH family outer membrane protein [Alphaproteobacteria bacterium]
MIKGPTMRTTIATLIIALAALMTTNIAQAQTAQTAKVIIVDITEITRSSLAGKDLLGQVETYRAEIDAEQQRIQQDVRTTQETLARQRDLMNPDAHAEKVRAEEQRIAAADQDLREKANRFQIASRAAERKLQSALNPIYLSIMSSYGANMLVERNQLILSGPGMDVTREVIEKLDVALPALQMVLPESSLNNN